jgi:hypothetical protein
MKHILLISPYRPNAPLKSDDGLEVSPAEDTKRREEIPIDGVE